MHRVRSSESTRVHALLCELALVASCVSAAIGCGDSARPSAPSFPGAAATDAALDAAQPDTSVRDAASSDADSADLDASTTDAAPRVMRDDLPAFCTRPTEDFVKDVFCGEKAPSITNLEDFQNTFYVNPRGPDPNNPPDEFRTALYLSPTNGDVAVIGHSTALPGHLISPLNPRTILMGERLIVAYQRGVQRVEIATLNRTTYTYNFYLLTFEQACNARDGGCKPGDLYTPKIESDWTRVQMRDDEDLKNTPSDCRQCHRRGRDKTTLLMRELKSPWTHFLFPIEASNTVPGVTGSDLMKDYLDAKGDELYGGLTMSYISPIAPFNLQQLVGNMQPLVFDAPGIETERFPYGPNGYPPEPGPSPTWNAAWDAFKRGEQLALPYVEQRAPDVGKTAKLIKAYQQYRAGAIDADALPDLGDIFPDDPHVRAQIGLQTEPDATAEDALIQACGSCHNDVLDQTISRARFSIALTRLDRDEIDTAIDRIDLPRNAPGAMPPPEARQLDSNVRDRLLQYLKQDLTKISVDPRLERAAQSGMMGGGSG